MDSEVRLVCFDLGGVLMRICDGWHHACKVAGYAAPERKLDAAVRVRLGEIVAQSDVGELSLDDFAKVAGPLLNVDPRQVIAISNAYLLGAYPGAAELLTELFERGVTTACLSNTNPSHWEMMNDPAHPAALPLEQLTHRFASHLIGARKPEAAIYQHVEQATGVTGESVLFFDDLPMNCDGAAKRGWRAYQINPAGDPIGQIRCHLEAQGVI